MEAFTKESVLKDMNIELPSSLLKVQYGSIEVQPGQVLTPTQVKDAPTLSWSSAPDKYYAIVMNDPDAPSRAEPKFREWHHWCVVNVPGGDMSKGDVLSEYISSAPPQGSGLHRYVFVVYEQPGKVTFSEKILKNNSGQGRGCHRVSEFAKKYGLGQAVAGNFYQAEWDTYVPKVYEQLSAGKK